MSSDPQQQVSKQHEKNEKAIGNVSSVFRELVHISHTNPYARQKQSFRDLESAANFGYEGQNNFGNDMGSRERQSKHNELMNRLRASKQQSMNLLGSKFQNSQNSPYSYQNRSMNSSNSHANWQLQAVSNQMQFGAQEHTYQNTLSHKKNAVKWTAPQMKYRHIEDQKKNERGKVQQIPTQNNNQISSNSIKGQLPAHLEEQMRMKEQFYENAENKHNRSEYNRKLRSEKSQQHFESDQEAGEVNEDDEKSFKTFTKLNPNQNSGAKYGQKLESYWDLCRKKPVRPHSNADSEVVLDSSKGVTQDYKLSQKTSEKFIRKSAPKVQGINIEKAMKILSFD